jgi:energy-coupling factor transporter transmembrane protein EcfT
MEDQKLRDYFKFDAADLQANRNGQFTEKQKARMVKDSKSNGIFDNLGAYLFVFIALIGVAVAIISFLATIPSSNYLAAIPFALGFGCIWPLVWGSFGVRGLFASNSSKYKFSLLKVQGYANFESRQTYDSNNRPDIVVYTLHIGGKNFKADKSLTGVFTQNAQYIVYYYIKDDLTALISTKNILSAELIS